MHTMMGADLSRDAITSWSILQSSIFSSSHNNISKWYKNIQIYFKLKYWCIEASARWWFSFEGINNDIFRRPDIDVMVQTASDCMPWCGVAVVAARNSYWPCRDLPCRKEGRDIRIRVKTLNQAKKNPISHPQCIQCWKCLFWKWNMLFGIENVFMT